MIIPNGIQMNELISRNFLSSTNASIYSTREFTVDNESWGYFPTPYILYQTQKKLKYKFATSNCPY